MCLFLRRGIFQPSRGNMDLGKIFRAETQRTANSIEEVLVMRRGILACVRALFSSWARPAAKADLVVNGGFETGTFSGWTVAASFNVCRWHQVLALADLDPTVVLLCCHGQCRRSWHYLPTLSTTTGQTYTLTMVLPAMVALR